MKDGSKEKKIAPEFDDLAPSPEETPYEKIVILYKEGKKYREIQKELGVSQGTIAKALGEAGLLGRQRRTEEVKKLIPLFDEEIVKTLLTVPFDYFAERYGEFWKLSRDEEAKLTSLSSRVASKWIPVWVEKFADEIALALTFGMVVYPRYLQTKKIVEGSKQKPEKTDSIKSSEEVSLSA